MTRPRSRRTAACLLTGLLTALTLMAPTPSAAAPEDRDPLWVTIDQITPSVIPARGPITVTGRITNTSESQWSELKVYLLTSYFPMTTEDELREAAASDPRSEFGERLTEPGQFVAVPDLAPGESTRYTLRLPRGQLRFLDEDGVYWLGVQVLGAEDGARIDGADGRARTFIPLIEPESTASTSLALMLDFRARIGYDSDGKVMLADRWRRAFSPSGRFGRLVGLTASAGAFPVSLVVDAALVDVARQLAAGNPGYLLGPADLSSPSPSPSPEEPSEEESEPERTPEEQAVQDWLDSFRAEAARNEVLALPYGDVDVAAAYTTSFGSFVEQATERAKETLTSIEVPSTPVVAPPSGQLPWEALEGIDDRVPVVLSDSSVAAPAPRVDVAGGPSLTLTDSDVDADVAGAARRVGALETRQRILAQAALHALSDRRDEPLVVQLPDRWNPGRGWQRAEFFEGLDVPWLTGTSAGSVMDRFTAESIDPGSDQLRYDDETPTTPAANFVSAGNLIGTGSTIDVLLPRNEILGPTLTGYAYVGTSVQEATRPQRAAQRTRALSDAVNELMELVTVTGPAFVTMSSEDGPFQVTLTNGLDQPVTVGVRARAIGTDKLTIPSPEPVTIAPGKRQSVRMQANSDRIGIWTVVLEPVNADGDPLGSTTEFKVRSSHVGQFIWGVLGVGGLVLLVAIFFRVRRKVRARQRTHDPVLERVET